MVADLGKENKPGHRESVGGLAVDGTYVYATHCYAKEEYPHASLAAAELIRIRHADFTEELPRVKLGYQPRGMAINPQPNVNCVYVVNSGQESFSLSIIDRATLTDVAGSPLKLGQGPVDVAVNTTTNRVYVTNGPNARSTFSRWSTRRPSSTRWWRRSRPTPDRSH